MVIKVGKPSTQQKPKCTSEKALWRENLGTKQRFKIRAHPPSGEWVDYMWAFKAVHQLYSK